MSCLHVLRICRAYMSCLYVVLICFAYMGVVSGSSKPTALQCRNPIRETLNPKRETLNPKPSALPARHMSCL